MEAQRALVTLWMAEWKLDFGHNCGQHLMALWLELGRYKDHPGNTQDRKWGSSLRRALKTRFYRLSESTKRDIEVLLPSTYECDLEIGSWKMIKLR